MDSLSIEFSLFSRVSVPHRTLMHTINARHIPRRRGPSLLWDVYMLASLEDFNRHSNLDPTF